MAGNRLLSQIILFIFILIILKYEIKNINIIKYFKINKIKLIIKNKEINQFKDDYFKNNKIIKINKDNQDNQDQDIIKLSSKGIYYLSIDSNILYDTEYSNNYWIGIENGIEKYNSLFWNQSEIHSKLESSIRPSQILQLNIIIGSEKGRINIKSKDIIQQVLFNIQESFKIFQQFIDVIITTRSIRYLNWRKYLKHINYTSIDELTLSKKTIFPLSNIHEEFNNQFPLSKISSKGILGTNNQLLSCDYQSQLCSSIYLLIYLPDSSDQPVEINDFDNYSNYKSNNHQSSSIKDYLSTQTFLIPSENIGISVLNDEYISPELNDRIVQDLTQQLLEQIKSLMLKPNFSFKQLFIKYPYSFETIESLLNYSQSIEITTNQRMNINEEYSIPKHLFFSYWDSRILITSWTFQLYSQAIKILEIIYSLYNEPINSGTGSYHQLDEKTLEKLENIYEKLNLFQIYLDKSNLSNFDERLQFIFQELSSYVIEMNKILYDPEHIHHRKDDFELISALVLPYWLPIAIPIVYGTYFEIVRYIKKITSKSL